MSLSIAAPVNRLGYGVVGFNILKAVTKLGYFPSLFPIGEIELENNDEDSTLVKTAMERAKFYDYDAPAVKIYHAHDLCMMPGASKRVGWPIFEMDRFKVDELHQLGSLDQIVVCSDWAKSIVEKSLPNKQVDVVPLGVDTSQFYVDEAAKSQRPYWDRDATVFLNCGKWEIRKGHDILLEAFNKAFSKDDNVTLVMLNDNPFLPVQTEQWKARYLSSPLYDKIRIVPRIASRDEMRILFNNVDWGVFPARAEGWNLEIPELMACGVPSIVSDYSGHTEFATATNSLLLSKTGMETAQDGVWFKGQGEWATFDVDELVELMRKAHQMKQSGDEDYERMSSRCVSDVEAAYTWEHSARRLMEVLS